MKLATLATLLTIVFVVLKLSHVIDWSWWLVFLPTIIQFGVAMILLAILGILAMLAD